MYAAQRVTTPAETAVQVLKNSILLRAKDMHAAHRVTASEDIVVLVLPAFYLLAFSLHARILEECLMVHSQPVFFHLIFFFLKWRLGCAH